MDTKKGQMEKRQSKETAKHETSKTLGTGKRNVVQDNKAHCSKKSKLSVHAESRTLSRDFCSELDKKDLNSTNLQISSDNRGNNERKCDKPSKKSKKKPDAENHPSAQDKNVSEEINCKDCRKSDNLLTMKPDANGPVAVYDLSPSVKTVKKIVQCVNCMKRAICDKKTSIDSNKSDGNNASDNGHSGNMVRQLPSKFSMFAELPKSLVENKFGLSTGQPASNVSSQHRDNLLHLLVDHSFGMKGGVRGKKVILEVMSNGISNFSLVYTGSPFDRRCTAMAWHPFNPNIVVVGSKGGDISLMDLKNRNRDVFIQGCGLGGVIQAMKFIPTTTTSLQLLTASMDGRVILRDLAVQSTLTTFVDTSPLIHEFWYCSCDVGPHCNMVVHGDSLGNATLHSMNGEKIWRHKLHGKKINHMEFHRTKEWLLCTASTDQCVSLWDIRMLKNRESYLAQLKHDKGVNSAYFSRTDGTRLLTTDQHHELRIYECGTWSLEQTIVHPHRFYQHLTPMKATWHPLEDMIVCGRYPEKSPSGFASDDERGIDFIDPFTSKNICRLYNPVANGIVTLAQFNNMGSILAATMGYTILIWQKDDTLEEDSKVKAKDRSYSVKPPDDSSSSGPKSRTRTKLLRSTKTKQLNQ